MGGKRPGKSVVVCRYGGFGDCIMAASAIAALKEEGFYVCLNTTERGADVMEFDPNIDELFVQDTDQVPNPELKEYWLKLGACFDKFVQLSESVEGRLLTLPGRPEHEWSKEKRHLFFNKNYLEETHRIAGVPFKPLGRFYPTKAEHRWAQDVRRRMGLNNFVIVWTLSGSSNHKAWFRIDQVIAWAMLAYPDVKFVLMGDGICQVVETGWEKEKRVLRRSGKWSIRKSLTFVEYADLIGGGETGVLNAAAMSDVPKVCLLSHSSPENLTKHWINTIAMTPEDTPCYPCHRMHYTPDWCNRDPEHNQAMCMFNISAERVEQVIDYHYQEWKMRFNQAVNH